MNWIEPSWSAPTWVRGLCTTTRNGGVSTGPFSGLNLADHVGDELSLVAQNRALLRARFALPAEPYWLRQVHGRIVADIGRFAVPPREILSWLGPAIGPQAFEVGAKVRARFLAQGGEDTKAAFVPVAGSESGWLANLYALARERLHACGVRPGVWGRALYPFRPRTLLLLQAR